MSAIKSAARRLMGETRLWHSLCVARYHLERKKGTLRRLYRTNPLVHRVRDMTPGLVYRRLQSPDFYGGFYFDAPKDPWEYSGYGGEYVDVDDFRQLAVQVRDLLGARSALDVGCAKGFLVRALRRQGVDAWGADLSEYAVNTAPDEVRPWLRVGRCQDLPFPDSLFDALILMETLEHIPPPELDRTLEEIRRLTKRWVLATIPAPGATAFGPGHALLPDMRPIPFFEPMVDLTPFRSLQRDLYGYPLHGHVTIATQDFWTALFSRHGFARRRRLEESVKEAVDTMRKGDWIPFVFERAADGGATKPLVRQWDMGFRELGGAWCSEILRLPAGRHLMRISLRLSALPPPQDPNRRCLHARAISLDGETMHGTCLLSRREVRKIESRGLLIISIPMACPEEGEVLVQVQGEPGLAFVPAAEVVFRSETGWDAPAAAPAIIPFPAYPAVEAEDDSVAFSDQPFSKRKIAL